MQVLLDVVLCALILIGTVALAKALARGDIVE